MATRRVMGDASQVAVECNFWVFSFKSPGAMPSSPPSFSRPLTYIIRWMQCDPSNAWSLRHAQAINRLSRSIGTELISPLSPTSPSSAIVPCCRRSRSSYTGTTSVWCTRSDGQPITHARLPLMHHHSLKYKNPPDPASWLHVCLN